MYQIRTQTGVLGYAEDPQFCYLLSSGSAQVVHPYERERARGLIYRGTIYNLPGHSDFEGAETANANECDVGILLTDMSAAQADTDALLIDQEIRLAELELGLDGEV